MENILKVKLLYMCLYVLLSACNAIYLFFSRKLSPPIGSNNPRLYAIEKIRLKENAINKFKNASLERILVFASTRL